MMKLLQFHQILTSSRPLTTWDLLSILFIHSILVNVKEILATPSDTSHMRNTKNVPCTFLETVNVTDDIRFDNGSHLHDGVLIPHHLIGIYDYIYKNLSQRIDVEPHYRGCICKVKSCVNLCCPWGSVYDKSVGQCMPSEMDEVQPDIAIMLHDQSDRSVNIFKEFAVKAFRPCETMYLLEPELEPSDEWHLFQNGTLLRVDDGKYLTTNEYCFQPVETNLTDVVYTIKPANCHVHSEFYTMKNINAYAMLFSIPFMVITIIIYLVIPELRNHHGKSLVCYLSGLSVGYSFLSMMSIYKTGTENIILCKLFSYITYFFFMAAFFWLSVISFDLWHNFRGTHGANRIHEKKRFLIYSMYAWGLAGVFLIFTWLAQEYFDIPINYKPNIGDNNICWLKMTSWSALIYFFGPILAIIFANSVMFVLTSLKIHRVQREMARVMAHDDSARNLRSEKDKFGLFLRLFIVMGVTWSLEIISYFVGSDKMWAKVFYIADICNAIQGFLIFILFVMKKKVKRLIVKSYLSIRNSERTSGQRQSQGQSQISTKTMTTSVASLSVKMTTPPPEKLLLMDYEMRSKCEKNN